MGLDGVEIVMLVDEEFGISIPDAEAEACRTVGQLVEAAFHNIKVLPPPSAESQRWRRARFRPTAPFTRDEVSLRVRKIVAEQLGLPLDDVREESRFIEDLSLD